MNICSDLLMQGPAIYKYIIIWKELRAAARNIYGIGTWGPKAPLCAGEDVEAAAAAAAAEAAVDADADADAAAADAAIRLCTLLEILATVVAFR